MALRQSDSAWAPCEYMWQDEGGRSEGQRGSKGVCWNNHTACMVSTAQTSLLRTQQPPHSLTQDAPFQFLEQFIIQARVCVSTHITCILLQRGSGFEPGFLPSCGKNTVITLSAS